MKKFPEEDRIAAPDAALMAEALYEAIWGDWAVLSMICLLCLSARWGCGVTRGCVVKKRAED